MTLPTEQDKELNDSPDILSLGTLSGDQLIRVGIDIEQ